MIAIIFNRGKTCLKKIGNFFFIFIVMINSIFIILVKLT